MYVIHFDLKPLNNDGNLQVCMYCIHAQKGASDAPRKLFRAFKILAFLVGVPPEPPHTICIIGPTFCICSRIKICKCVGMYMVCACMHGWVHVCKQGVLVCVCVCVYVYQLHFHGVLGLSEMNLEVHQYTYHEASVSKLVSKYLQDREGYF